MADVHEGGYLGGATCHRTRGAPLLAQVSRCSQIKSTTDRESSNLWIITPSRSEEIFRHLTATLELRQLLSSRPCQLLSLTHQNVGNWACVGVSRRVWTGPKITSYANEEPLLIRRSQVRLLHAPPISKRLSAMRAVSFGLGLPWNYISPCFEACRSLRGTGTLSSRYSSPP